MKRVVTGGELTQDAMRPADLMDGYLARAGADIARFELLQGGRERPCPACGGAGRVEFARLGFPYQRCHACASLFVSPLPDPARLARYHAEGEAERFRREQMLPLTADVRSRHALGPRARWVLSAVAGLRGDVTLAHAGPDLSHLAGLLGPSIALVPLPDAPDPKAPPLAGVVAFDVLERAADLAQALGRCRVALRPGGLLFVTTMSGDGLELRVLGARARNLVPPVHLHLLSREGWAAALGRAGFTLVEYSTPGELDVQAVADASRRDPELPLPPIVAELVRHEDEQVRRAFQEVLQQAGLSTHVQLLATADGNARHTS